MIHCTAGRQVDAGTGQMGQQTRPRDTDTNQRISCRLHVGLHLLPLEESSLGLPICCHMPAGGILDPWEDHTMLKSQPYHQTRLGGHQQLPLSPLVQQDERDSQGKANLTEITMQGYEGGSGSYNPPSLPIADPPPRYPRAPGPPARLFVLRSRRRRCAGVGCSPRRCFALSRHRAARLGLPTRR